MARETPMERFQRLMSVGDTLGALQVADDIVAKSPDGVAGRVARARAYVRLSRHTEAAWEIAKARTIAPNDELVRIMGADVDLRRGRVAASIDALRPIAHGRGQHAASATITLLLALIQSGRMDELRDEVAREGPWRSLPRARVIQAQALASVDPGAGIERLKELFGSMVEPEIRRVAAFEAVTLLDRAGRYREAFDLATAAHAATTDPLQYDDWIAYLKQQLSLLERGPGFFKPRAAPVEGTALIVALPRSGTTLLEKMLDQHPQVSGIGEFDGLDFIVQTLYGTGPWPRVPSAVPDARFGELQRHYLAGAADIRRADASWSMDKSLRAWRALPEIACVLPGACLISVDRDPRDNATSLFLSHFHRKSHNWTQSFQAIREIIELQRQVVSRAIEVLGLRHVEVIYENLVSDPARYASRCLAMMGLEMNDAVLAPEKDTRALPTLSHAQVRQRINKRSIARWRNYEWAFDSSWDAVVAMHEARRSASE